MRIAHFFACAVAVAGSALLSLPAGAQRVCNQNCVGPICNELCVDHDRDVTVGRGSRDRDVIIEERGRRDRDVIIEDRSRPDVEIRRSRPGVDIEGR